MVSCAPAVATRRPRGATLCRPPCVPSIPRTVSPRFSRQLEQLRPTSPERSRPWKIRGWDSRARTLRNERLGSDEEGRRLKGIARGTVRESGIGWGQSDEIEG